MLLRLPKSLHYPITITKVQKQVGDPVARNDGLFVYSYMTKVRQGDGRYDVREEKDLPWVDKKLITHFPSSLEGRVKGWRVWEGDVISQAVDVCEIEEECPHTSQYYGLCGNCGKDMTGIDANSGTSNLDRAPIHMAHNTLGLAVSKDEASRIDGDVKVRLLSERKLSLVVDLDQTIIQACVEPTIGLWQEDKDNPNHEVVKNIGKFQLKDDPQGARGCWYYIKLRPGLAQFLENMSHLYEMHVYTMGTRNYADAVANLVDPTQKYFSDRILSRDESGSLVAKSLERLFPVDDRMVVIIDDRGDVWKWSANLIRVRAFEFFVGIGDINSSFLPKQQQLPPVPPPQLVESSPDAADNGVGEPNQTNGTDTENVPATVDATENLEHLMSLGADDTAVRELQQKGQEEIINSQLEDKPLLKMQMQQDEKDEASAAANGDAAATQATESDSSDSSESSDASTPKQKPRHSILRDDDEELIHLEAALSKVHEKFFAEYDRKRTGRKGGRVAELTGKRKAPLPSEDDIEGTSTDLVYVPDIKVVMPSLKIRTLSGVKIVFSGVIPLGVDIQTCDIGLWAQSFGATIVDKIGKGVTHVIAARPGTAKVKQAVKRGIPVVSLAWLHASIAQWRKADEKAYLLEGVGKQKQDAPNELDDYEYARIGGHLSSSEDGENTGLETEDDQPARKKLKLDTSKNDNAETDEVDDFVDDGSPVTIDKAEWDNMEDEFTAEFGSDFEESDTESVLSIREGGTKKRGREEDETDDSDLERSPSRKRNGTGSALKTVSKAITPPVEPAADDEDDSDDELARELQAELDADAEAEEKAQNGE